jgi:hypothetical protein
MTSLVENPAITSAALLLLVLALAPSLAMVLRWAQRDWTWPPFFFSIILFLAISFLCRDFSRGAICSRSSGRVCTEPSTTRCASLSYWRPPELSPFILATACRPSDHGYSRQAQKSGVSHASIWLASSALPLHSA